MLTFCGKIAHWPQWLAGFALSLGLLGSGAVFGWTSPLLAQFTASNNTLSLSLSPSEASWFASLLSLGKLAGVIIGTSIQDTIGRKRTLLLNGVPMTVGWICILCATSVFWLYASRVLFGLASGLLSSGMTLFLGEIADPNIRGSLIFLIINVGSIGSFLGNVMGPYLSMETVSYIGLVGNGMYMIFFSLVPDSPYHHIANGNIEKAENSLKWFKRDANVKQEIQEMQEFMLGSTTVSLSRRLWEMKNPEHMKKLSMVLCLDLFLYCAGYTTMSYYAEIILTKSEVLVTPSTIVIALGFASIIAGATAIIMIDKFGRKSILIASALVTAFSLVLLGAHFYMLSIQFDPSSTTWVPILALFLYNFGSHYGIVPVPVVLVSELFPPIVKTVVIMLYSAISSLMAFVLSKCFQSYINLVGEKYVFWTFALSAICIVPFTYFVVPETKGKSLVEIQEIISKDHHETADSGRDTPSSPRG